MTFVNHPSGAPVVWLASGSVTISGTIEVTGAAGTGAVGQLAEPGFGGFRGGRAWLSAASQGSGGLGPGGGIYIESNSQAGNGSYATVGAGPRSGPVYGNSGLLPLIGGSGGAGNGNAAVGAGAGNPDYTFKTSLDADDPVPWSAVSAPPVRVTTINGVAVPADPNADMISPPGDVSLTAASAVPLALEAVNVPSNATVTVRIVCKSGQDYTVPASFVSGTTALSTWSATVTALPAAGFAAIQATAVLP